MPAYRFFPTADVAQDHIWRYTLDVWGEDQAEKYIIGLHLHLTRLASSKLIWRRLPAAFRAIEGEHEKIFISRYDHHLVFFKELSDGDIGILALLHEKSDLPKRLAQELRRLTKREN